jgi:hypothetical protein
MHFPRSVAKRRYLLAFFAPLVAIASVTAPVYAQTPTPTASEILERASARIAETNSMSFTLDVEGPTYVDSEETIRLLEASGELTRPDRVHAEFKAQVLDSVTVTMEIITIGDQTWSTDLITGDWNSAPAEFVYNPAILFDTNEGVGPVMDRVSNPRRLDDEEIRGRDAFHVQAEVEGDVIGPLTSHTLTGSPVTVDLWIDQSTYDLLRAKLSESPAEEDDPATWTLDLDDHDESFEIEPPDTAN